VLLRKRKDWYVLFIFIFSLMIHFFVQSSQDPHLWEEWLPPTFYSILIFETHAHLASVLLHNLSLLHWRVTGPLQWSLPSTMTHL
jgi:hypothetical protein